MIPKIITDSSRKVSLDIIKILAAFMVVLYHLDQTFFGFIPDQFYFPNFNKLCLSFCAMSVPLFFMVNGTLTLRKERPFSYHFQKALKTGFLYVFWICLIEGGAHLLTICNIIKSDLPISLTGHLWFLRTLMILYIISYIIRRLYTNKIIMWLLCTGAFIFPFLYNYLVVGAKLFHIAVLETLPRTGLFTLYSVLYFVIGKFISDALNLKSLHEKRIYIVFEIVAIIVGWLFVNAELIIMTNYDNKLFDGVNASFPTIGALLMAVGAFSLLNRIKTVSSEALSRIIGFFSRNNMGIYLIHPIIIGIIKIFVTEKLNILFSILLTLFVMLVSAVITEVLQKIPYVKKLFVI